MAVRGTNTMAEALQRMLGDISQMKTLPDGDLEYLANLETMVLKKLREPIDAVQAMGLSQAGGGGQPGAMPPGMGPGGGMQMPPAGPPMGGQGAGGIPQGMPGMQQGPAMPNPDELRRLLGAR